MRDVNNGWLVRYLHSNTASAFFFLVYLHIGRGIYYGSYRAPRTLVWAIGTVILILMMATKKVMWPNWLEDSQVKCKNNNQPSVLPFNKGRTKAVQRIGPHNIDGLSVIICGMLGDFWGDKIKGQQMDSVRFCIEQSVKNSAYIHHLNILLYNLGYCSTVTPKLIVKSEAKVDKRLDPTLTRYNYRLTTHSFTSLLWIYNSFYYEVNGTRIKKIPGWIGEFITPIGLAHWIMQDGSRQKNQGINIATNSFSFNDCLYLSKILNEKYGLKTSVIKAGHINQWKISIWKESMADLVLIVKPYIVDEMKYKFIGYI